jgi:tripartite-type tricarboxylate transporter receptor subunit TctC
VAETVPNFEGSGWQGVGVPRNTPAEVIEKLNSDFDAGLRDPKIVTRITDLGGSVLAGSPADFEKLIADETEKWGRVVKFAGIKAE